MKKQVKAVLAWLKVDRANTAEENTNRGLWWVVGILAVGIVAGVMYFVVGHAMSQSQSGADKLTTQMATQGGLTNLATQAEAGSVQGGTNSVGTGYKGP